MFILHILYVAKYTYRFAFFIHIKNDEEGKAELTNNFIGKNSVSDTAERNPQNNKNP